MFEATLVAMVLLALGHLLGVIYAVLQARELRMAQRKGKYWADRSVQLFERGWGSLEESLRDDPEDFIDWYEGSPSHDMCKASIARGSSRFRLAAKAAFDEAWSQHRRAFLEQNRPTAPAMAEERTDGIGPRRLIRR